MEEFVARLAKIAEFIEGIVADKAELEAAIVRLEEAAAKAKGEPEEAPVDPEPVDPEPVDPEPAE